jgi:hypothetical protein
MTGPVISDDHDDVERQNAGIEESTNWLEESFKMLFVIVVVGDPQLADVRTPLDWQR